jgi:hypothetical protein
MIKFVVHECDHWIFADLQPFTFIAKFGVTCKNSSPNYVSKLTNLEQMYCGYVDILLVL